MYLDYNPVTKLSYTPPNGAEIRQDRFLGVVRDQVRSYLVKAIPLFSGEQEHAWN